MFLLSTIFKAPKSSSGKVPLSLFPCSFACSQFCIPSFPSFRPDQVHKAWATDKAHSPTIRSTIYVPQEAGVRVSAHPVFASGLLAAEWPGLLLLVNSSKKSYLQAHVCGQFFFSPIISYFPFISNIFRRAPSNEGNAKIQGVLLK
jgi:hypothetical protein